MKKIFLLFTFLFIAKTNFAQLNWSPIANGGFNTGGTNIQFLQKHGPYVFSGVYNPSASKIQAYYAAMDTVNSFLPIPFTSLDMLGDTAVTSVTSTQSGGGYLYLGTSSATAQGGNVYGTADNGTTWNKIFSNAHGLGNNNAVRSVTVVNSGGTDSLLVSVQKPYTTTNNNFNINTSSTVTTLTGNFYDSGGPVYGYNNYEDYTTTFFPNTPGDFVRLTFNSFSSEPGYDYLYIYDGDNTGAPLIATFNGTIGLPNVQTATNPQGALTIRWHSDVSATYNGWDATISNVNISNITVPAPPTNLTHYFKGALDASSNSSWIEIDSIADYIVGNACLNNKFYALGIKGNLYRKDSLHNPWVDLGNLTATNIDFTHFDVFNNHLFLSAQSGSGAYIWSIDTNLNVVNITNTGFGYYSGCPDFSSTKTTATAIYYVSNGNPSIIWKSTNGINFYTISNNGMNNENAGIGAYVDEFLGNAIASGYANGNAGGAQVWVACLPPSANITYSGNQSGACLNEVKTFAAAPGAISYKWYVNDSLYQSGPDSIFAPGAIFSVPNVYTDIHLKTQGTVCGDSSTVSFYVGNLPTTPTLTFNDTTICPGTSIYIEDLNQGGGFRTMGGIYYSVLASNLQVLSNTGGYVSYNATPDSSSTYYVVGIDYYGCKSPYDTVHINTFVAPNTGVSTTMFGYCTGQSTLLVGTGADVYDWYEDWKGPYYLQTSDFIYLDYESSFFVTGIDTITGCTTDFTFDMTEHPMPIVNIGQDPTICQGQGITLNAAAINGTSGSWYPSVGLSSDSTTATNANPDTTTTYIFTSYTAFGCAATDTITVNVNPYPTPAIVGADTVCNGASGVAYSTAVVAGNTNTWSVNGGVIVSGQGTQSIIVNWINPSVASITCIETNTATGCSGTASKNITINSVLPTITANNSVCAGSLNEIASVNALAGSTYNWTVNGGAITAGQGTDSISINWGMGSFGVISLTQTSIEGCLGTATQNITLNSPVISISPTSTVCSGSTNVTYAVANNAGSTYTWAVSGGTIVSGQNTNSLVVNWAYGAIGNISVTETNVMGCTASSSVNITLTTPIVTITPTSAQCAGATNVVYSVANNAGSTYSWTIAGGIIVSGQTSDSVIVNWGNGTIGNVTATEVNAAGCTANSSANITLNAPIVAITPTNSVCAGATNVVYSVTNNAGSTYNWTINGGTIVSGQSTNSVTVNWNNGAFGNISVSETNTSGCTATSSANITLNAPSVTISPSTPICSGATNVVYAVTNNAGSTYSWTINGGTITAGQNTNSITVNWNNGAFGNLTATETNASGCVGTTSVNITLTSPIVSITPSTAVCAGATNVIYSVANNAGSTYNWTIGGGTIVSGQSTDSITVNWGTNAFGNLTATETNANGCIGTASVNISLTAPIPVITPTSAACSGATGVVYSTTLNAGSSYNWAIAGGSITAGQGTNSITVDWNNGVLGNLAVTETSAGGCTGSSSANITLTAPVVSAGSDVSICSGSNTTLNGSATGAGPITFAWTPSTTLSSAVIANPVATPTANTTYTLTATDVNGCSASDQVTVSLNSIFSTFTGNVQYDSLGTIKVVRAGTVKAFSADSAGLIYPVSIAYISSNGTFSLYGIPAGNYKIFIEPNSNIYPYLSNIYYNGANLWEDANPITFSCGNTINQTINLPDYVAPVLGTASISGRILADANYQGKTTVQGDPIPGVDVALEQNPGSTMLSTTTTNNNGDFFFFNLSPNVGGTWYTLLVNIPGYGLDSTYEHIVIGSNQSSVHNDYLVGDSVIYIDSALSATLNSVKSIIKSDLVANFQSYPNPYSLETTINYSIVSDAAVKLDVYNALGQRVESIVNTTQASGNYKYTFGAKSSGVYYVRLVVNDKVSVLKLVEM